MILVDDGSTDGTAKILKELVDAHRKKIHLITFPENRGKGAALIAGINYAVKQMQFDILVTLDSDGQHKPSEIGKVASFVKEGAALSIGSRDFSVMPFRSRFANTFISFLLRLLFPKAPRDNQSGFRAFSKKLIEKINTEVTGSRYEMEFRCLLLALRDKDLIASPIIETIYIDQNRSSHFGKIRDSFRILSVLFHFWRTRSI